MSARGSTERQCPLDVGPDSSSDDVRRAVAEWVERCVPRPWIEAGRRGGPAAVREVRSRAQYEAWYPLFGRSGLVAPTWPRQYGGLDLAPAHARAAEEVLRPFNLGRLNPLGLNLCAPALLAHGTEEQRLRFLPPIVRNEEVWCQLFSEPGAGSDLASLATRAERDGDRWLVRGHKIWSTWAHLADFAVLLARTDPGRPKRQGLTYFLLEMHQPRVVVRPLRDMVGRYEFNEVFLDGAVVPDGQVVGTAGDGWRVANATLSGERQMVAGSGSGGVDRIGGSDASHLAGLARQASASGRTRGWEDALRRGEVVGLWCEEQIREWTNRRARARLRAGLPPGPESSIGKVHQGGLNQRIQLAASAMLGSGGSTWEAGGDSWDRSMPPELKGMLRSRANTIEGGTTEVNKNILGERVLGLPREPDPYRDVAWRDVPRS